MSRSRYIYILTCHGEGDPLCVGTVKHEVETWASQHGYNELNSRLYSTRDGEAYNLTLLTNWGWIYDKKDDTHKWGFCHNGLGVYAEDGKYFINVVKPGHIELYIAISTKLNDALREAYQLFQGVNRAK